MVRAILDNDIIVKLTMKEDIGTEIGSLPKENGQTVGLERLRWNGSEIIDISTIVPSTGFHVEPTFKLHVVPLPKTRHVEMTYDERKILKNDQGTLRPKTRSELLVEADIRYINKRKSEYPDVGAQVGVLMQMFATSAAYPTTYDELPREMKILLSDIDVVKTKFPRADNEDIPSASRLGIKEH